MSVGRCPVLDPAESVRCACRRDGQGRVAPPVGMSGRFNGSDARPGGGYRMTSTYDDEAAKGSRGGAPTSSR